MQAGSQGDCSAGLLIMSEWQHQAGPVKRGWINQEGSHETTEICTKASLFGVSTMS